jgi:hypothetical protein
MLCCLRLGGLHEQAVNVGPMFVVAKAAALALLIGKLYTVAPGVQTCCKKIAEAEAVVSDNEKKWLVQTCAEVLTRCLLYMCRFCDAVLEHNGLAVRGNIRPGLICTFMQGSQL